MELSSLHILNSLRQRGFWESVQKIHRRLIPLAIFDFDIFLISTFDFDRAEQKSDDAIKLRWAGQDEIDVLVSGGLDRQKIESFFAQGARVAVAELSGQVIGYQWVALETWAIYNWLCISIDPNSMWFTTAFVAPDFRGHDISPKLKTFVFQSLGAEGMDEAWALVQFLNRSSIAALSKVGLRVVEKFVYLRLLGLTAVKIGPRWQAGFWRASNRLVVPVEMFKDVPSTD